MQTPTSILYTVNLDSDICSEILDQAQREYIARRRSESLSVLYAKHVQNSKRRSIACGKIDGRTIPSSLENWMD